MKTYLMHPDRDFDPNAALPWNQDDLVRDLELDTLLDAMAAGDGFIRETARQTLLTGMANDAETILYRQAILADALRNPGVLNRLYDIAVTAIEREKRDYLGSLGRYPAWILYRSREVLAMFVDLLKELRSIADDQGQTFQSPGFKRFFAMLAAELDDAYFARIDQHLKRLKFSGGVLISARLGRGNKGCDYALRKPLADRRGLVTKLLGPKPLTFRFRLDPRDETGARTLSAIKDQGIADIANALAQATDHILGFFTLLRRELAFYLGAVHLHERLTGLGAQICFPAAMPAQSASVSGLGLCDPCLTLNLDRKTVANRLDADGKELIVVTGANQGGKSTFLRSIGLAQLMLQAGLFVSAESFRAALCDGLFTHYKREEDVSLESGKFDEELKRMSAVIDHLGAHPLLLLNESFAATNEREGSEIAAEITRALLERKRRTIFVTHLYAFAHDLFTHGLFGRHLDQILFLRAERHEDGSRSFKIVPGEPLETSYGEDLYRRIFTDAPQPEPCRCGLGQRPSGPDQGEQKPSKTGKSQVTRRSRLDPMQG